MDVMVSGHFKRGRIHVSIDIFNLNIFLSRRWETIIVFPPSRGLLSGFNIYALAIFRAFVAAVVTAGSASAPPAKIFQTAVPCGTVVVAMLVVGV